ncbi:MAG TPA: FAD-dependent oxidoreductase [archaeon]|nr:FAD-dependent oxidoreductase [archaeon]
MTKLVIIGLSSGGFGALLVAKKFDPKAEITVIDKKPFDLLHMCGLPYALEGIMPLEDLKHDVGLERMRVKKIQGIATKINTQKKLVFVEGKESVPYDSVIISTGATPLIPQIDGVDELLGKKIHTVYNYDDTKKLDSAIQKGKKAVVIGGGPIGLEVGIALHARGMHVKIIEAMPKILPKALDADMVGQIEEYFAKKGIEILSEKKVTKISKDAIFIEEEKIDCDLVVLNVGVKPNTKLAKESGIELGQRGVKVDRFFRTSAENVFAIGDLVEVPNMVDGNTLTVGLANSSYMQGMIAAENALGGKREYAGTALTFTTVLGDLEVASTGLAKNFAETQGIKVVDARAKGKNKYDWYPGAQELTIKILVNESTGKIVGCQAVGKDAYHRVNVVSTAIRAGMTVNQLADVEMAYCPPLSEAHDILLLTCELVKRKLARSQNGS